MLTSRLLHVLEKMHVKRQISLIKHALLRLSDFAQRQHDSIED